MPGRQEEAQIPLYVDLDGTLIKSDVALELSGRLLSRPSLWPAALRALLSGRATFKRLLSEHVTFDETLLPYEDAVLDYIKAERAKGRRIVLATGCDRVAAEKIAKFLGVFDAVLAASPGHNLTGEAKRQAICEDADGQPYEYLGNSAVDHVIWEGAARIGVVNARKSVEARALKHADVALHVQERPAKLPQILRAMRPHQWAKNILVLLPLFFSHNYANPEALADSLLAVAVFSICASAIYIFNDLLDIEADRQHSRKRHRPFAAGVLSPVTGYLTAAGLLMLALVISLSQFHWPVTALFAIYVLTTTLYSTWFKHKAAVDIVVLTCLYALRIFVGGVVIGVLVSPWLLNFSLFFFASLALMKRFTEIKKIEMSPKTTKIRGYYPSDIQAILPMGITSGGLAVLTLTMYLNSAFVAETYGAPELLWLLAPLVLFWIFRAWLLALRDHIDDDPVVFALRDRISQIFVLLCAALVLAAKFITLEGIPL